MSRPHLLDANVLIALALGNHEHHQRAATWWVGVDRAALCPSVEGSLVRFVLRLGHDRATALALLEGIYASGRCDFWADDLSYTQVDLDHVRGHRQVTDAYLASLAARHGGILATFDQALAAALPDAVTPIP